MRGMLLLGAAVLAFAGARVAKSAANDARPQDLVDTPFAPSQSSAPFVSLGYREAMADLLWVRLTGYFGGDRNTSDGVAGLVEAIVELDPRFKRVYEWGARAMTIAHYGVGQDSYLRAIAVLDRGTHEFPDDYRMPNLEGQLYTQDLVTTDPAQRRAWDEAGTLLVESAIRKPGAPADAATWAAMMRTKLGQVERARQGIEEVLMTTNDRKVQDRLLEQLADLEKRDAAQVRAEIVWARMRFETAWRHDRPELPATMYVLLGPRIPAAFDLGDLAAGGDLLDVAAMTPPAELPPPSDDDGSAGSGSGSP